MDIFKIVTNNNMDKILKSIKIKPMSAEQLIISADRLTRFKQTETKYLRVFKDILSANLILPKFKKRELDEMSYTDIKNYAEEIINYSLETLGLTLNNNFVINQRLYDYEKSIFHLDENTQSLLKNKINYDALIKLFSDNIPKNLRWLKTLSTGNDILNAREENAQLYPIEKVIITEGITEEILLPVFARNCGYDFNKNGIYLISAGGKNQVVKLFYKLSETLKLPIFVLLDKDAEENLKEIKPKLREMDRIHLLRSGEFEDLLPHELIQRTLNDDFKNFSRIELECLKQDMPMVKILEELFKEKGLHEFKKAEFAELVAKQILSPADVSEEIQDIINEIKASSGRTSIYT